VVVETVIVRVVLTKHFIIRDVVCGSAFNLALSEIKGMVQMWGIYTTNKETHNNTCIFFYINQFFLGIIRSWLVFS
jgi:hypothetical protein